MATVDIALANWALDEAKRKGASAAEVLCVSAESLEAGVRMGEVEKLKSSRERRLGLRVFCGQSSATSSTAELERDSLERVHREHGRTRAPVGRRSVGGIARPVAASEVVARAFARRSRQRNRERGSRARDRAHRRERGAEVRSAHQEFRWRRIQLRALPGAVRQQPGLLRRIFRHFVQPRRRADRAGWRRDATGILVHLESPLRKTRRRRSRSASPPPSAQSAGSARARSKRRTRRWFSIPTWRPA